MNPLTVSIEWILASFAKRKSATMKHYAMFVAEGVNQPFQQCMNGAVHDWGQIFDLRSGGLTVRPWQDH